ncbi:MAG: laccase domain-containing protein [Verrucomicrobia bacterium]|nr:laccase domain-containing protein [Verrucomicrobiota bacterium]
MTVPVENFPALEERRFAHAFVGRVPGIELSTDKQTVLARLDEVHGSVRGELGVGSYAFATAQQLHGNGVAIIDAPLAHDRCFSNCDGMITNQRNVCLGIYVADCCAVYLADRQHRAIGLVHSGKKGTDLGIVPKAIGLLHEHFGIAPADLVAQLSPCIRPPHYEVDFAAQIIEQCRAAGVDETHDTGRCTACDLGRYYSYRAEKGRTGRMLALLAL